MRSGSTLASVSYRSARLWSDHPSRSRDDGLLAVFTAFEREILAERTRAGLSKSEIARRLQIGRTSVRRILISEGT